MGIKIENIHKKFFSKSKVTHTLSDINLDFKKGEFICLLGPSGCGKSTLLNIVAGLETPTDGKVYLNNEPIKGVGVDRAVMFQESALFPWLKVRENVEFGMKVAGVSKEERKEKALKYLKMVHLTKFEDSYVHELSGGMRQRVALARALTLDSEVLLMDEPFSALDSQTKSILQTELQKIWWETKKTIIFVTHNVEEAVFLADRIIVMSANPGKVKKVFNIEVGRPRKVDSMDLAYISSEVMEVLKEEVEKVAKREYDPDWDIEKDSVLYSPGTDMGVGL